MQSVIKRPCPATRIHFQPYGQPTVERKTTTGERHPAETRGRHIGRPYRAYVNYIRRAGCPHPAASSRGSPSTGSHPRRGRCPRRPGNLLPPPIPGKTSGPGMPGPYKAVQRQMGNRGKPPGIILIIPQKPALAYHPQTCYNACIFIQINRIFKKELYYGPRRA